LLLAEPRGVLLLEAVMRHPILLLELRGPLVRQPLLLQQPSAVLLLARLLQLDELVLALG
jgi:hypothetical protein